MEELFSQYTDLCFEIEDRQNELWELQGKRDKLVAEIAEKHPDNWRTKCIIAENKEN